MQYPAPLGSDEIFAEIVEISDERSERDTPVDVTPGTEAGDPRFVFERTTP